MVQKCAHACKALKEFAHAYAAWSTNFKAWPGPANYNAAPVVSLPQQSICTMSRSLHHINGLDIRRMWCHIPLNLMYSSADVRIDMR